MYQNHRHVQSTKKTESQAMPDWYWKKGLHDAHILGAVVFTPNQVAASNHIANGLELLLDSSIAMFDTDICTIRFYNYKEITPEISLTDSWWKEDSVLKNGNKFILQLKLMKQNRQYVYQLRFEKCEVIRSQ